MENHNLEINFSKTKLITFHPHQKATIKLNYSYNNTKLEQVNEFTLLGITIDTHVNWKVHIQKIRAKLSKFSYALREIKKTTNLQTALVTYYAYAQAWLSYGIILWGNTANHISKKHKILTLTCLYILEICKFVRLHPEFYNARQDIQKKYSLRHKNRLNLPTSNLKIHSSGPLIMSIKIYNNLPRMIKDETKTSVFLNKLITFLHSKCYYSIKEFMDDKSIKK
ncbi:hypothetical protein SFRURICE_010225 [Spodoptera frugiperda]|nr:hypothetical protein SFRURICE_010225 [Spodoptera frugiperda]